MTRTTERGPWAWRLAAPILAAAVRMWAATWRVEVAMDESARALLERGDPCLVVHWHDAIPTLVGARLGLPVRALLSTSRDGRRVAALLPWLAIRPVRGSGRTTRDGVKLFFAARGALASGALTLALDGSRGPRREARGGAAVLGRATGAPLLPVACSSSWAWTLRRSWDRARIPLPFARVRLAVGEPRAADAGVAGAVEAIEDLESRLAKPLPRDRAASALVRAGGRVRAVGLLFVALAGAAWVGGRGEAPKVGSTDGPVVAPATTVRFAAVGDTGRVTAGQTAMAAVLADVCARQGCDFVLLLGDNAYEEGLKSIEDPRWATLFEEPFAAVDAPFHPVLGNHDGGKRGMGLDLARGDVQVAYSAASVRWSMPGRWYSLRRGVVDLFALDTPLAQLDGLGEPVVGRYGDRMDAQRAWVQEAVASSTARWRIAYGHHPLRSNGRHGDAGDYDGAGLVPFVNGAGVRDFLQDELCGRVDLYLAGHDHNRQWLVPDCEGTELMVLGAGAKTTELTGSHPVRFADDQLTGFAWFEATATVLRAELWNERGERDFAGVVNGR